MVGDECLCRAVVLEGVPGRFDTEITVTGTRSETSLKINWLSSILVDLDPCCAEIGYQL